MNMTVTTVLNDVALSESPMIGHSMGWLSSKCSPSIHLRSLLISMSGNQISEIICSDDEGLEISSQNKYLSIHLPSYSNFKNATKSKLNYTGKATRNIFKSTNAFNATLHSDLANEDLVKWLKNLDIPLSLENMGREKASGKLPLDVIRKSKEYKLPIVLDLQHAYEISLDLYGQDKTSEIAVQLATLAKKAYGISLIHLSGEISLNNKVFSNHASLLSATNKTQIFDALIKVCKILDGHIPPIILEGDYLPFIKPGLKSQKSISNILSTAAFNMKLEKDLVLNVLGKNSSELSNKMIAV